MSTKKLVSVLEKQVGTLTFGMFLRVAREQMELTQSEMAKRLKISRGTLCDMEKGRQLVSPELASRIAKSAGLSEVLAVKTCLQDQLKKAKLRMLVDVKAA